MTKDETIESVLIFTIVLVASTLVAFCCFFPPKEKPITFDSFVQVTPTPVVPMTVEDIMADWDLYQAREMKKLDTTHLFEQMILADQDVRDYALKLIYKHRKSVSKEERKELNHLIAKYNALLDRRSK